MLKVTAIPLNIVQGDRDANLANVERLIAALPPDNDVVVLPEFFSTGFYSERYDLEHIAETGTGFTMQAISQMARQYNMAIAGTFIARVAHAFYNRAFFMEPSGEENFYDKRHLFGLSPESETFHAGNKPMPIIRFRGWNIALMVCYDLRFPVWSRNKDYEYDLLIIPANWPQARAYAWKHLLIARAIENQAYVIGANRSGSDAFGEYNDISYIFDYLGKPIGNQSLNAPIISASLSAENLKEMRQKFPVANDADRFSIEI